jgi:hypothetical protein
MSIALAEADKYEVLEKIGKSSNAGNFRSRTETDRSPGSGSFGVIRKVRRKSDGFVREPEMEDATVS